MQGGPVPPHHPVIAVLPHRVNPPGAGELPEDALILCRVERCRCFAVFPKVDFPAARPDGLLTHPGAGGRTAPVAAQDAHRQIVPPAQFPGKVVSHGAEPAELIRRRLAPPAVTGQVIGLFQLARVGYFGVIKKAQSSIGTVGTHGLHIGVVAHIEFHVGLARREPDLPDLHIPKPQAASAAAQGHLLAKGDGQRADRELPAAVRRRAGAGVTPLYRHFHLGAGVRQAPDRNRGSPLQNHTVLKQQCGFEHCVFLPSGAGGASFLCRLPSRPQRVEKLDTLQKGQQPRTAAAAACRRAAGPALRPEIARRRR